MHSEFINRMKEYIPAQWEEFEQTLSNPMYKGLRVNTKKISIEDFRNQFEVELEPTPFCKEGFYVQETYGNHPFHIAGLFYHQEPSASSVASLLDIQPDQAVLDLCAAPGGKSTQIAQYISGDGFLVANEIESKRSRILLSNMERMGVMNMMVTNGTPHQICGMFKGCFDRILVDAPCSGEGMMKKHDVAKDEWSLERIQTCATRQKEILKEAYQALKKDGILVYSTCTYAREENEDVIEWMLETYPDMRLVPIEENFGRCGFLEGTRRIYPMDKGEGHFVAKLQKVSGESRSFSYKKEKKVEPIVRTFIQEQLCFLPKHILVEKDKVYAMDVPFVDVPCLRQGILIGELKKSRLEPAHAFYMNATWIDSYKQKVECSKEEMDDYMHGNQIMKESPKGYVAMCYKGYPFGFGKSDGKRINNKIPKGLRLLPSSHIK